MALRCGISCVWNVHVCNIFYRDSVKCGHNDGRQNASLDQNNNNNTTKKNRKNVRRQVIALYNAAQCVCILYIVPFFPIPFPFPFFSYFSSNFFLVLPTIPDIFSCSLWLYFFISLAAQKKKNSIAFFTRAHTLPYHVE